MLALVALGLRLAGVLPGSSLVGSGVLADRDQLVLAEFVDRANDSTLATAVTEAFRVDFEESELVGLANPDRVRGALRFMQRPDSARLTPALAREVAVRTGLKAVLTGEVCRLGDGYEISAQVIGADSGQALAARRETAASARDIIPAVDRLSRSLRNSVGESLRRVRASPPLEEVTTGSLDALRKYGLGARLLRVGRFDEAVPFFEAAVQLDTAFAMAWHGLGVALWNLRTDPKRDLEALTRAYQLRDRLTERQRYAAEAQYFEWIQGDRANARTAWSALLALDPQNVAALTNLGLLTWFEGDYTAAADLAERAIRVDSSTLAPYTNLVDAQVTLGRFAAAETTLARWRGRFGAGGQYPVQVGTMAAARFDYDSAERAFERGLAEPGSTGERVYALGMLARVATARGRLDDARAHARRAAALGGARRGPLNVRLVEAGAAVYLGLDHGNRGGRLEQLVTSPEFTRADSSQRPYDFLAVLYALAGKPERGRELGAVAVRSAGVEDPGLNAALEAALLLDQRRYDEAADRFWQAHIVLGGVTWLPEMALALDRAGETDSALAVYQRYLSSAWNYRLFADAWNLGPALKRTGELYEAKGERAKALESYRRLAELWRDADPVLRGEVTEVRRRLAELTAEPR